tara:strand:- start:2349 stop:2567 length:219 start_codon:yes stop_codon:yes gene_type:complete
MKTKELEIEMLLSELGASVKFTVTTDQLDLDPDYTKYLGLVHDAVYKLFRNTPLDIEDVYCEDDHIEEMADD